MEGCSSSFAVQLSTSWRRAREAASAKRRNSSPRTDARASATVSAVGSGAPARGGGDDPRQQAGVQQRAPRAQVRPHAVLQAGDDDDVELPADERRRRGDERRSRRCAAGRASPRGARSPAPRRRIGPRARRARARRISWRPRTGPPPRRAPGSPPRRARRCPWPAHPTRPRARCASQSDQSTSSIVPPASATRPRRGEQLGEPCRAAAGRRIDGLEAAGCGERVDEQLVARPAHPPPRAPRAAARAGGGGGRRRRGGRAAR